VTERDADLDAFAAAFAARIDRDIARAAPVPDIADVWARVAALDESLVPEDLELDDDEGSVVPLARARALLSSSERNDLAPFTAALRERVEMQLHERGMSEIPARKLRAVRTSTALLAIAAALVLAVVGGLVAVRARVLPSDEAPHTVERMLATDRNWAPRIPARATERVPPANPAPFVETPIEAPAIETPAPRVRPKVDVDAELDELEARAQATWQAGDLAGAEKLLREVIRRARRGVRVELAYGDLFAIARQRGGASAQIAVWREYLRRSPDGRFADDVQAGLCRHAPSADAADCWADYLRARPNGAHAKEARKTSGLAALDPDEGAP
jgi:hypothetical protein